MDFLEFGDYKEIEYQSEKFYEIDLFSPYFFDMYYNNFFKYCICDFFHIKQLKLIVPINIDKYAKEGLTTDIKPFLYDSNDNVYIDNDRIGLKIR